MKITISRPINLLDENGKLLEFDTVKEAINFLADHDCTIEDLRELDFNVEAGA